MAAVEVQYSRVRDEDVLYDPRDGFRTAQETMLGPHVVQSVRTNIGLKIPEGQAVLVLPRIRLPFTVTPQILTGVIPEVTLELRSHKNHLISEHTVVADMFVVPCNFVTKEKR